MRLKEMVSGWMAEHPVTMSPGRPVVEAYALMAEHGIRHLPVVEGERLVGIISDRDLHRRAPLGRAREGVQDLFRTPVSEIMTRESFVTVDPMSTLEEAASLLVRHKVHSLPVIDRDRLVGILTTHDILRALTGLPREKP
jgi:acetoin utilization protein AcuB